MIVLAPPTWTNPGCAVISADGRFVLACEHGTAGTDVQPVALWQWDLHTASAPKQVLRLKTTLLQISPTGKTVAWCDSQSDTIRLRGVPTGKTVQASREGSSYQFAFTPDGKTIITINDPYTSSPVLRRIATASGRTLRVVPLEGIPNTVRITGSIAVHPTGDRFAIQFRNAARSWSLPVTLGLWSLDGVSLKTSATILSTGTSLAFSPDGSTLAGASLSEMTLYDGSTLKEQRRFVVNGDNCKAPASGRPTVKPIHIIESVAFSPDGRRLAAVCSHHAIHMLEVTSGLEAFRWEWGLGRVHQFAFATAAPVAIAASDQGIVVWDTE